MRRVIIAFALATLASTAYAQSEPMPAGYDDPGPEPSNVLPGIVEHLRRQLRDPSLVRDFTLCRPNRVNAYEVNRRWQHARWAVTFTLNSRNAFGGYVGSTMYNAEVEGGVVTGVTEFHGIDLLPASVNERLIARAQSCPRVPDAEIRRLLDQPATQYGTPAGGSDDRPAAK